MLKVQVTENLTDIVTEFNFRTIKEAKALAEHLHQNLGISYEVTLGLIEILVNSIEHGNLGISYEQKKQWKKQNVWDERLSAIEAQNTDKAVYLKVVQQPGLITIYIRDQGDGFNFSSYTKDFPKAHDDPNGRGMMIIMHSGFKKVDYLGKGNEVICEIDLPK
jgi:anti-sigma regulatory factor (Ser/Thr protein kinase)